MVNTKPTRAEFYLCEDVRSEEGGRNTLVGLYPGNKILVRPPADGSVVADRLAILAVLFGGSGEAKMSVVLTDPDGQAAELHLPKPVHLKGDTHSVKIRFRPFLIAAFGTYVVTVSFDDKVFTYSFEVLSRGEPVEGPAILSALTDGT